MAEETQYTAKTGIAQINTANTALDGSGTLTLVINGASKGTLIKTVTIKAVGATTKGMVRLFIEDLSRKIVLLTEIEIPAISETAIRPTFETTIPLNFTLKDKYQLKASTQNAETFNIIAEGLSWAYYHSDVRQDTTKYTPKFGCAAIATANSNLNGTGVIGTVYTAGSSPTYNGSSISTVNIKSTVNVTPGMIRLFINDGTTSYLFKEIIVPTVTASATDQSFNYCVDFENDFDLQAGYSIGASTQVAQNSNVFAEGNDWNYYS